MNRLVSTILFAASFVLGCTAPVATLPKKVEPVVEPVEAAPWRVNLLPLEGITVEMPGIAEDRWTTLPVGKDPRVWFHHLAYVSSDSSLRFQAGVYTKGNRNSRWTTQDILDEVRGTVAKIQVQEHTGYRDFDGVKIIGIAESGGFVTVRTYEVGEYVYALRVEGTTRESTEAEAQRFFDSFRLELPFRIFSLPDDYCLIALPLPAKYKTIPLEKTQDSATSRKMHFFTFRPDDGYFLSAIPITADTDDLAIAEEVLEEITDGLAKKPGYVIERMASVTVDDAPGRDVIFRTGDGVFSRVMIVVKNQRSYIATRTAMKREKMDDADTIKYFASFTIGRAP